MISQQQYEEFKARNEKYEVWIATSPLVNRSKSGACSYKIEHKPSYALNNAELSAMEVYEFMTDPPKKYFAYVNMQTLKVTSWTGDTIGTISAYARPWRSNFGDTRQNITVNAINGKQYYGVYYTSAGDYCRLTMHKSQDTVRLPSTQQR